MRHQDLLQTVSQVTKRYPKRTPKMRMMIINGLAKVVVKSARMAQTRNPASLVPTEWPDNQDYPAVLRFLRLTVLEGWHSHQH